MCDKALIKESLSVLEVCGLNPANRSFFSRVRSAFAILMLSHWVTEMGLQIGLNWRGWHSSESIMICGAAGQGFLKSLLLLYNNKRLVSLLTDMNVFSSFEGLDAEFTNSMKRFIERSRTLVMSFFYFTLTTLTLFCLKPLVSPVRSLPFQSYHPVDLSVTHQYAVMYVMQILAGCADEFTAVGYDLLFISFVMQMIFELKIVKRKFETIDVRIDAEGEDDCCLKELSCMVDHHNLILKCIRAMDQIYSFYLLLQFSSSAGFICVTLLGMVAKGFPLSLQDYMEFLSFLISALSQLFVYCITGMYLMSESESVSEAIYASDWWAKTQPKFRKACVLIIQRSNKTESLTAGGMIVLNLENFTKVVKLGLSVFSLAQAINQGN